MWNRRRLNFQKLKAYRQKCLYSDHLRAQTANVFRLRVIEPWPSLWQVVFHEAIRDLRALLLCQQLCGRDYTIKLLEEGIDPITFKHYPHSAEHILDLRRRVNKAIADKTNTDINEPGPEVGEETFKNLRDAIAKRINPGDIVIMSGSLPKGAQTSLYREWVDFFNVLGAKVVLDADGEPMRQGVLAKPYLMKPNDLDLSGLVGRALSGDEQLIAAGKQLVESGVQEVLISRGDKGAIYLAQEGIYKADGLKVPVLSTVGAGDYMVAAMANGFEKKMPAQDRLRLAVAMGSASVMCSGTQAPEGNLVWKLFEQVDVREV